MARVKRLVYGANDPKTGAFGSKLDINRLRLNHKVLVTKGILKEDCAKLLKAFFRKKR